MYHCASATGPEIIFFQTLKIMKMKVFFNDENMIFKLHFQLKLKKYIFCFKIGLLKQFDIFIKCNKLLAEKDVKMIIIDELYN